MQAHMNAPSVHRQAAKPCKTSSTRPIESHAQRKRSSTVPRVLSTRTPPALSAANLADIKEIKDLAVDTDLKDMQIRDVKVRYAESSYPRPCIPSIVPAHVKSPRLGC